MEVIKISNLTKDYGNNKGIFNVNIQVNKGEVFGFLGPNGAGKTTTIRNLMGFIKADSGKCEILNKDCFKEASKIQKSLGYLAGEISFFDDLNGSQFLDFMADMKGLKDKRRMNELIDKFELDPRGKIKKMSKGMKQKLGIIIAFMSEPEVLILDEPTSGLDPLMQSKFIELILEEKEKGKTIFMSSHIFEEIEKTCDRTAIIREGKIVAVEDMKSLSSKKSKIYVLTLENQEEVNKIKKDNFIIKEVKGLDVSIKVKGNINEFILGISKYKISDMNIKSESLEEIFMHYYGKDEE